MKKLCLSLFWIFLVASTYGQAQQITYSEPDREDARAMGFEVIGKISGKILVYKNFRDLNYICVFDNNMKMVQKQKLNYLPDRMLSTDFQLYPDFAYLFYQYQRRNVLYAMAVKLDADGNKVGEPIQLDTTNNPGVSNNKIYSILFSDDKQKIMIFKISSRNERMHILTTLLFDKELNLLKKAA